MTFRHLAGSALALSCTLTPKMAMARQDIRLETQMFVERVQTDINGRPRRTLASAERARAGDQLIFVVQWRNQGNEPIQGLAVTRPAPRRAQLAQPDAASQVSVDGGQHWGKLEELWLPTPLGGVRRAVPADITHVRWIMPTRISPGESGRLSYRATMR